MKLTEERKQELREKVKVIFDDFKKKYPNIITVPMTNSIDKIEALGIFILRSAAPDEVSGFCMTIGENTFIFINKNHTLGRQNFSLWHEVYHWFTESTGVVSIKGDSNNNEIEFCADYFASLVMIDEEVLKEKLNESGYSYKNIKFIRNTQIIKLQHFFNVSYTAMVRKLIEIFPNADLSMRYGLGTPKREDELLDETAKLGLDVQLIKPVNESYMSSEIFQLLENLYDQNKITKFKLESLIDFITKELM